MPQLMAVPVGRALESPRSASVPLCLPGCVCRKVNPDCCHRHRTHTKQATTAEIVYYDPRLLLRIMLLFRHKSIDLWEKFPEYFLVKQVVALGFDCCGGPTNQMRQPPTSIHWGMGGEATTCLSCRASIFGTFIIYRRFRKSQSRFAQRVNYSDTKFIPLVNGNYHQATYNAIPFA